MPHDYDRQVVLCLQEAIGHSHLLRLSPRWNIQHPQLPNDTLTFTEENGIISFQGNIAALSQLTAKSRLYIVGAHGLAGENKLYNKDKTKKYFASMLAEQLIVIAKQAGARIDDRVLTISLITCHAGLATSTHIFQGHDLLLNNSFAAHLLYELHKRNFACQINARLGKMRTFKNESTSIKRTVIKNIDAPHDPRNKVIYYYREGFQTIKMAYDCSEYRKQVFEVLTDCLIHTPLREKKYGLIKLINTFMHYSDEEIWRELNSSRMLDKNDRYKINSHYHFLSKLFQQDTRTAKELQKLRIQFPTASNPLAISKSLTPPLISPRRSPIVIAPTPPELPEWDF